MGKVRYHLGHRTERWKWNFVFFIGFLFLLTVSCLICRRYDLSAISRQGTAKMFLRIEENLVKGDETPTPKAGKPPVDNKLAVPKGLQRDQRVGKLQAECGRQLRSRSLTGYFVDLEKRKGGPVGKIDPGFHQSIQKQKTLIDSGQKFDTSKIPFYRLTVEFQKLHCRLIVAEMGPPKP